MKTFKVTFFDKFDIFKVETFHNVTNQAAFGELLAVNIVTLELAPVVRCFTSDGKDYTKAVNMFLKQDIAEIDKDYAINYFKEMDAIND